VWSASKSYWQQQIHNSPAAAGAAQRSKADAATLKRHKHSITNQTKLGRTALLHIKERSA
jgi:hypothetical protein